MPADDFCLKWNDHHSVFFSSAERLCRTELLTDVTLSCGGREFAAHKLVLSVCSGYFAGLFARRQPMQKAGGGHAMQMMPVQTIVYLKDVEARHMELILDYMYRGEINVQENDLMGLLATAKGLQVKGLTDAGDDTPSRSSSAKQTRAKAAYKRPASVALTGDADAASTAEGKRIKEESAAAAAAAAGSSGVVLAEGGDDNGEDAEQGAASAEEDMPPRQQHQQAFQAEEEGFVEEYGGEEGGYDDEEEGFEQDDDDQDMGTVKFVDDKSCPVCGKSFCTSTVMRRHFVTVHTKKRPFTCWLCKHSANRKSSLKEHCFRSHGMKEEEFEQKAKEAFKKIKYSQMIEDDE